MEQKIIFNADDFGISQGVNQAIFEAYQKGVLNSASLMVNQKYAEEAVEMKQQMPGLDLGLHVNLTNEYPAAEAAKIPLLVDENGKFKNGFLKLLLLSLFKAQDLSTQVATEVQAQIEKARHMGVNLTHIDSHRHVHMIPAIFSVFRRLMKEYDIPRTRVINECALLTASNNHGFSYLFDGGLIKYFLLRFFSFINGYASPIYFYTMLYTCKLSRQRFNKVKIPVGFNQVEIMIHPAKPDIDKKHEADVFDQNILSPWRQKELETLLDKTILKDFEFNCPYPWVIQFYQGMEKWWFNLNQKLRFLLVGGFNTVFSYAVYAFLLKIIALPYEWALVVQYFITVNVSIVTMRYYVFRSLGGFLREYGKAWLVYIGMFVFNFVCLKFLVEICGIGELTAQAVYLTISTILTYLLHKYFSFGKKIKEK